MLFDPAHTETPYGQELVRHELEHTQDLLSLLERYNPQEKESFAVVIQTCTNHGLSQARLADEFKVSSGTISRWARGRSIPPYYARKSVVERIVQIFRNEIKESEPLIKVA